MVTSLEPASDGSAATSPRIKPLGEPFVTMWKCFGSATSPAAGFHIRTLFNRPLYILKLPSQVCAAVSPAPSCRRTSTGFSVEPLNTSAFSKAGCESKTRRTFRVRRYFRPGRFLASRFSESASAANVYVHVALWQSDCVTAFSHSPCQGSSTGSSMVGMCGGA